MTVSIFDPTTRAAFIAATTQQAQCEAVIAPWAGGNVVARVLGSGGALRQTVTLGPWTIEPTTPREVRHGARLAFTTVSTGDIERIEYRTSGGALIFTVSAGVGATAAAVDFAGPIRTLCGVNLSAAAFTANPALPVVENPLDASLNLIAAAHGAGQMWVQLNAGRNGIGDVQPPADLRDDSSGSPAGLGGMIYAWPSFAYDPVGHRAYKWGIGHANSSWNGVISWSPVSRDFRLDFHGSGMVNVNPGPNTHRSFDFNGTPASSHTYGNNVWLPYLGRLLTFGGAAWNDGDRLRVFDPAIPGNQPGLRAAGAFSLNVSQAGTGKVAGATGSNDRRGSFGDLEGANAWTLHDWFDPAHPSRPVFGGTTYSEHINRGAWATVEGGKDVVYYTSNSYGLLRAEFVDGNPANDLNSFICSGLDFDGAGEVGGGGVIDGDPTDRVILSLAVGAGSNPPFRFVDLKRPTRSWRVPTSVGGVVASLKSENKGSPGLFWNPVDQCWVACTRGNLATPGIFPAGVWEITKPAPDSGTGYTPDTGWSVARRDKGASDPGPFAGPLSGELFVPICGRIRWADDMKVGLYFYGSASTLDPLDTEVWAYIPRNWVDPRS